MGNHLSSLDPKSELCPDYPFLGVHQNKSVVWIQIHKFYQEMDPDNTDSSQS